LSLISLSLTLIALTLHIEVLHENLTKQQLLERARRNQDTTTPTTIRSSEGGQVFPLWGKEGDHG